MSLLLIRHTAPAVAPGVCYGHSDLPLRNEHQEDFNSLTQRLQHADFGEFTMARNPRLFCSPAKRCHQLAQHLFPHQDITLDPRLREINFGRWELQPWDRIPLAMLDAWAADVTGFCPPGGESYGDLYRRCRSFAEQHLELQSLLVDSPRHSVVIAHGGVIRSLLAFFLHQQQDEVSTTGPGEPTDQLTALLEEPIEFGSMCRVTLEAETQQVRYTISSGDPRQST